jgi:hypothetical protein
MKTVLCLTCNKQCHFCLDEWGHTPFHLHCDNCDINIGATSINKCIELLQQYHKPNTYLEYYQGDIQLLFINNDLIINKEIS